KFKGNKPIGDLGVYLRNYLKDNNDVRIYVGTDSMVGRNCINYVIAIVLYKEGKGGHIIYARDIINFFNKKETKFNLQSRLLAEVERSLKVADYLEVELEGCFKRLNPNEKLVDIDLDLNPNFG